MAEASRAELTERALAQEALLERRARTDLGQFIVNTSPEFQRPSHLQPLLSLLDRAMVEPVFATISVPPRHGKTESLLAGIVRMLRYHPERTNAYATYAQALADRKSRRCREVAIKAGVPLFSTSRKDRFNPAQRVDYWQTAERGGLLAVGAGAGFTGDGVTGLCVIDDPHKDRADAESATSRENTWEWFVSVPLTRREDQASVIVTHTRWHPGDLIGRIKGSPGFGHWQHINLPAIATEDDLLGRSPGQALWPAKFSAEVLLAQRGMVGEYTWWSLYQGEPRPRGGKLFGPANYYAKLPDTHIELCYGIDLAYSKKSQSDWSVIVLMAKTKNALFQDVYYVLHVDRVQVKSPEFGALLKRRLELTYGPVYWRASGTERGTADLLAPIIQVPIQVLELKGDKFTHAQPLSAAWNAGRVLLPLQSISGGAQPPWVAAFVKELEDFTGINDAWDDQVDALVNAFDGLTGAPVSYDAEYDQYLPPLRI